MEGRKERLESGGEYEGENGAGWRVESDGECEEESGDWRKVGGELG